MELVESYLRNKYLEVLACTFEIFSHISKGECFASILGVRSEQGFLQSRKHAGVRMSSIGIPSHLVKKGKNPLLHPHF